MSVVFRYAELDEYPRISAFLDRYWAKDHIYVRRKDLFDWTFVRKTHWSEGGYSFAVAEDGGEIVGILGGIPFHLNALGRRSSGVWIVNYAVRPDYRKGSTAFQLLSNFRREPFSVVIACGLNPATTVIYRVLRGMVLPETPRHFAILPRCKERMIHLLRLTYPDWSRERAASVSSAFQLNDLYETTCEVGSGIPVEWDEADWPSIAAETVGAVRDTEYLNWRYRSHPLFEYRFLTVTEGARTGLIVWRLETIVRSTEGGREDVDKVGRLVEFLPASRANARDLAQAFFQELASSGALGADFYGYNGGGRGLLEENELRDVGKHPDGVMIPSRFQPLDGHGGAMLNAMFMQTSLPCCGVDADCPWYWTKSDSDQDRPN